MTKNQQFGVSAVPFHTHNGVDSPVIKTPVYAYSGQVDSNGLDALLPAHWSSIHSPVANGTYTITHNLGNDLYAVVASSYTSAVIPTFTINKNDFVVSWRTGGGTLTDNGFSFIVVSGQLNISQSGKMHI